MDNERRIRTYTLETSPQTVRAGSCVTLLSASPGYGADLGRTVHIHALERNSDDQEEHFQDIEFRTLGDGDAVPQGFRFLDTIDWQESTMLGLHLVSRSHLFYRRAGERANGVE